MIFVFTTYFTREYRVESINYVPVNDTKSTRRKKAHLDRKRTNYIVKIGILYVYVSRRIYNRSKFVFDSCKNSYFR